MYFSLCVLRLLADPGNVAVDATGKLIYYDFGMCGTIPPTTKSGLQELFYGIYERNPEKCLAGMTKMGVYVPTGDKVAIRRTAEFFLKIFSERLDNQVKERVENGGQMNDFKPQRTKEEAKERRKVILQSIGEDLLLAANDQPFR